MVFRSDLLKLVEKGFVADPQFVRGAFAIPAGRNGRAIWVDAARVTSFSDRGLRCPFDLTVRAAALSAAREIVWSPMATNVLIAV